MKIIKTKEELFPHVQKLKEEGHCIGYVPTMGALHEGHLSLVDIARTRADYIVVSIFVNPTQFAPHEDLASYPRDLEEDARKLEAYGVDLIYAPQEGDLYPDGLKSTLKAGSKAMRLETDFRPGHFDGVVTVLERLFTHVQPDIAVFGEKDYQQLQVLKEMVRAENLPLKIISAPLIRDEHGLALSSRNAYLSEGELEIARMLNQALHHCAANIAVGFDPEEATQSARETLLTCGFDSVDYVSAWEGRVLAAVRIGATRLIDNAVIDTIL